MAIKSIILIKRMSRNWEVYNYHNYTGWTNKLSGYITIFTRFTASNDYNTDPLEHLIDDGTKDNLNLLVLQYIDFNLDPDGRSW